MKTKLFIFIIFAVMTTLAFRSTSSLTDRVSDDENALIAAQFLDALPLPLPVEFKVSPESLQALSKTKGIFRAAINPGQLHLLGDRLQKGRALIKQFGSEKVNGAISAFERNHMKRRDIIVLDPFNEDGDVVRIIAGGDNGSGRAVDITLTHDPKSTVFSMPDKFFIVEGLYDGDGEGISLAVVIDDSGILKPILLPIMKKGEKIKVQIS